MLNSVNSVRKTLGKFGRLLGSSGSRFHVAILANDEVAASVCVADFNNPRHLGPLVCFVRLVGEGGGEVMSERALGLGFRAEEATQSRALPVFLA